MSYAQIIDVAGEDMPHYMKVMDAVGPEPVQGLIVHAAGPTAAGIQIITIWTSRADQERFITERLHPAFATLPNPSRRRSAHDDRTRPPQPGDRTRGEVVTGAMAARILTHDRRRHQEAVR